MKQTTKHTAETKLPWFSRLLRHSARKRGELILQRPRVPHSKMIKIWKQRVVLIDCKTYGGSWWRWSRVVNSRCTSGTADRQEHNCGPMSQHIYIGDLSTDVRLKSISRRNVIGRTTSYVVVVASRRLNTDSPYRYCHNNYKSCRCLVLCAGRTNRLAQRGGFHLVHR